VLGCSGALSCGAASDSGFSHVRFTRRHGPQLQASSKRADYLRRLERARPRRRGHWQPSRSKLQGPSGRLPQPSLRLEDGNCRGSRCRCAGGRSEGHGSATCIGAPPRIEDVGGRWATGYHCRENEPEPHRCLHRCVAASSWRSSFGVPRARQPALGAQFKGGQRLRHHRSCHDYQHRMLVVPCRHGCCVARCARRPHRFRYCGWCEPSGDIARGGRSLRRPEPRRHAVAHGTLPHLQRCRRRLRAE